jgi:hypothetical protein
VCGRAVDGQVVITTEGIFQGLASWLMCSRPSDGDLHEHPHPRVSCTRKTPGNRYSRNHTSLDPDVDAAFWRFTWSDIADYDVPAMVGHVADVTGQQRVVYFGYSQVQWGRRCDARVRA